MAKSREQFEEEYHKLMGTPVSVITVMREDENYRYTDGDRLQISWKMWQASRAVIEIELPYYCEGYVHDPELINAIKSHGLKVKE